MAHIRVDFLSRRQFHGLDDDDQPDWPPSPLRLLGALIAGAHALEDEERRDAALDAIERLTQTAAPAIRVPSSVTLDHPDTYTEKNAPGTATASAGALKDVLDLTHTRMGSSSRIAKPVRGILLEQPTILFDVGDMTENDVPALQDAASAVGYFGRSHDHAMLTVHTTSPPTIAGGTTLYPHHDSRGSQRGWTSASVAWFDARHRAIIAEPGSPLPSGAGAFTRLTYAPTPSASRATVDETAEGQPIAVMFTRGIRLGDIPRELRKIPELPTGVRAVPLVNFNRPSAKCYGLAVTGTLESRLLAVGVIERHLGALISDETGVESPLFHRYATMTPGSEWITATPVRAFGHPLILRQALTDAFGAEIDIIDSSTRPLDTWQQRLPNLDVADGLSQWFVRFNTSVDVAAPVMAGAHTELGFGLCVPIPSNEGPR